MEKYSMWFNIPHWSWNLFISNTNLLLQIQTYYWKYIKKTQSETTFPCTLSFSLTDMNLFKCDSTVVVSFDMISQSLILQMRQCETEVYQRN